MTPDTSAAEDDAIARLARLPPATRDRVLRSLTLEQRRELNARWRRWAHAGQIEPSGDWRVWLIRAGRGFGKTRAGAEWVTAIARDNPHARIALVGGTAEDVRAVMIEGPSGLIATARDDEPAHWKASVREVEFHSGARAMIYSAEAPEKLRGPEHHAAWCDELAKWRNGDATWDNLMMGMRLGDRPRVLVTTTPRPVALLRKVRAMAGVEETLGRTRDNPHLPANFIAAMEELYGGTRLGRQELDGEMIEDVVGALWTRDAIELCRAAGAPELVRVVIGVDPPAGTGGDACGIVAAGLGRDGRGYVLDDASVGGASPEGCRRGLCSRHRWCRGRLGALRLAGERRGADGDLRGGARRGLGVAARADPSGRRDPGGVSLRPSRRRRCAARGGDGAVAAVPPNADRRSGAGMMEAIEARGRAIAAEAQGQAIARIAERAHEALPEVVVTPEPDGVALAGRGLARRMLDEPALRWIGSLVR